MSLKICICENFMNKPEGEQQDTSDEDNNQSKDSQRN